MSSCNLQLRKPIPPTLKLLVLLICFLGAAAVSPSFAQTKSEKRVKPGESERTKLAKLTNPAARAKSLIKIATIELTFANDAIAAQDRSGLNASVAEYQRTMP